MYPDIITYVGNGMCTWYLLLHCWEGSETTCVPISGVLLNELQYAPTTEYYVVINKNEKTLYTGMVHSQRNIVKWKKKVQNSVYGMLPCEWKGENTYVIFA